jgi:hypothetical protein
MRTYSKRSLIALVLTLTSVANAQTPNDIFRGARIAVTKDAVSDQGLVPIGGIPQWISVRGRHQSAPLLLFLHGGPGFTVSPVSYYYMRDWEELSPSCSGINAARARHIRPAIPPRSRRT